MKKSKEKEEIVMKGLVRVRIGDKIVEVIPNWVEISDSEYTTSISFSKDEAIQLAKEILNNYGK